MSIGMRGVSYLKPIMGSFSLWKRSYTLYTSPVVYTKSTLSDAVKSPIQKDPPSVPSVACFCWFLIYIPRPLLTYFSELLIEDMTTVLIEVRGDIPLTDSVPQRELIPAPQLLTGRSQVLSCFADSLSATLLSLVPGY